ncbi:hypothetical protein KCP69_17270 [Salmonella enterica subsp. enterica]|nr:hypothetical protein KCP69_17270 [Salmonella enterica subsp. enterica]
MNVEPRIIAQLCPMPVLRRTGGELPGINHPLSLLVRNMVSFAKRRSGHGAFIAGCPKTPAAVVMRAVPPEHSLW